MGATFPLFTIRMFEKLGIGRATSLLGFIFVAMDLIPWITRDRRSGEPANLRRRRSSFSRLLTNWLRHLEKFLKGFSKIDVDSILLKRSRGMVT